MKKSEIIDEFEMSEIANALRAVADMLDEKPRKRKKCELMSLTKNELILQVIIMDNLFPHTRPIIDRFISNIENKEQS